jgi:tetratricopeptide (TPR) repeat protein
VPPTPKRVAELSSKSGFASGYLIASDLVLTASHGVDGSVIVRLGEGETERHHKGAVCWRGDHVDAALIRLDRALPRITAVRFGRFTAASSVVNVTAIGFPESQKHPDGWRDAEQLQGQISASTGAVGHRYQIQIAGTAAAPRHGQSSWAGMSGAAVWAGELLLGIVVEDPVQYGHGRLVIEPVYRVLAETGFRRTVTDAGVTVHAESVEFAPLLAVPRRLTPTSPSELLHPAHEVVPFQGRADECDDLRQWSSGTGAEMLLLHGAGGQGKTRLANQFVGDRRRAGWTAGFIAHAVTDEVEPPPALNALTVPTLLVVDYAETRPNLIGRLAAIQPAEEDSPPLRILLLARSAGDWWDDLGSRPGMRMTSRLLGPLHREQEARAGGYEQALDAFAEALCKVDEYRHVDWGAVAQNLARHADTDETGRVLSLHAAALAALLQGGPTPVSDGPVRDVLLGHERRYWRKSAATHGLVLSDTTLALAVATATLVGPSTVPEADQILGILRLLRDQTADARLRLRRWLQELYPADTDSAWAPLEPDRLGERLAVQVINDMPTWPLEIVPAMGERHRRQALVVLSRAAGDHRTAAAAAAEMVASSTSMVFASLDVVPHAEHPGPLLRGLERTLRENAISTHDLTAIGAALPVRTTALSGWAAEVSKHLVARRRADPTAVDNLSFAAELTQLSRREAAAGHTAAGLAAAEEAVSLLYQEVMVAESSSDAALSVLCHALNALGNRLGEDHRKAAALVIAEQEMAVAEHLAEIGSPDVEVVLARAYNNAGVRLAAVGRNDEALIAVKGAVELRRELARVDPAQHLPNLALSLNNLSVRLDRIGDVDQAVVAIEESVRIRRRLAQQRPDAHLPGLALSLNNLAARLADLGRPGEALKAIDEAVAIRRELAAARPQRFSKSLALSLTNRYWRLTEVNRHVEALADIKAAVAIRRRLSDDNPRISRSSLAWSITCLAACLRQVGDLPGALQAACEAVTLGRIIVTTESEATEEAMRLAYSLATLADILAAKGAHEEALLHLEEALALDRVHLGAASRRDRERHADRLRQRETLIVSREQKLFGEGRPPHAGTGGA